MKMKLPQLLLVLISVSIITSCAKDKDFKKFYGKSGIWEIESLTVDYVSSAGAVDSSSSYSNCGMFIFYNVDIGAEQAEYNGQIAITTYIEKHLGCAWYPENDELKIKLTASSTPERVYTIAKNGETQTWKYTGANNHFLPGDSPNIIETLVVHRIKTN